MSKYLLVGIVIVIVAGGIWWATQRQDTPNDLSVITADVTSGNAPLTVTFTPRFMGMGDIWVEFGDGARVRPSCEAKPDTDGCKGEYMSPITHTYTTAGIYTVTYANQATADYKDVFGTMAVTVR